MTKDTRFFNSTSMKVNHYENFPVGSLLIPTQLRVPVRQIYHFARTADDIADEGNASNSERLEALLIYENNFRDHLEKNKKENHLFLALGKTIEKHNLPKALFFDLLHAFKQDVTKMRYETFNDLLHYCKHSANPIGRLILHLSKDVSPANLHMADQICTSLQIINFLQDIKIDYDKNNRIYLPKDELSRFKINENHINSAILDHLWVEFMDFQICRVQKILDEGEPLGSKIGGRLGLEIKVITLAAYEILKKLRNINGNIFSQRPILKKTDWPMILVKALLK